MNNKVNTKDNIIRLVRDNLELTDNHTVNIINAVNILKTHGVKCKLKQGWKVNIHKNYNREAYLYIEMYIKGKKYFIDVTDDIYMTRCLSKGVFNKKPSEKYIASKLVN